MNQTREKSQFHLMYSLKCGLASFLSTCISGTLLHPLELIKVRFQSHDGQANQKNIVPKYRNVINAIKEIITGEGYSGLYKGLSISVMSAAISSSIYEKRKKALLQGKDLDKQHQMYEVLRAGIQSGVIVTLITQPMWVVKTRMLLNTKKHLKQSSNIFFTIRQIKNQHSYPGFYKGLSMNLCLSFQGAIQMLTYEGSKHLYDSLSIPQTPFMQKTFICGGLSKIGSVLISYPLTTIRTRIQQNQYVKINPQEAKYQNVVDIVLRTARQEGVRGFYKGLSANILRGIPERSIFFYSYEALKRVMIRDEMY